MPTEKREVGDEVLSGLREIKRGEFGRVITVPSIARIRAETRLSQARFAKLLGVSVRTLQDWEQGRRAPSGAARTLLLIAVKNPRALHDVARSNPGAPRQALQGNLRNLRNLRITGARCSGCGQ
jgi:putative transcriptional regulator